jgi:hypothetical protein
VTCDDARSRRVPNRCLSFSYLCQLKLVTNLGGYGPFGDWTGILVAKILQHDFPSIAKLAVMAVLQVLRYIYAYSYRIILLSNSTAATITSSSLWSRRRSATTGGSSPKTFPTHSALASIVPGRTNITTLQSLATIAFLFLIKDINHLCPSEKFVLKNTTTKLVRLYSHIYILIYSHILIQ